MTTSWEQTPAAVLRAGTTPRALATVPGRDERTGAERHPEQAAEHRAAWDSSRWVTPSGAVIDNAAIRDEQRRLAADDFPIGWLDFPELGKPPKELRALFASALAAQTTRVGTATPGAGADAQFEQMLAESDYAKTPWSMGPGGGRLP